MKNNETGEFELVVGDRQLLSAFFIVVLLCAVAFAMGYVVGQSAPKGKVSAESTPATSPIIRDINSPRFHQGARRLGKIARSSVMMRSRR